MKQNDRAAVVVLSGGQDSATCLFIAKQDFDVVHTVVFDYGQRHRVEIQSATKVAYLGGADSIEVVKLDNTLRSFSPLMTREAIPQYENHDNLPDGIQRTFVPMRNQLFLTIAANRAYLYGATNLVTGVSEEDYGGYPDCRQYFINLLETTCNAGTFTGDEGTLGPLRIHTPLMRKTKRDAVLLALSLEGCYGALAYTHTAYDGSYPPGKDHASLLRAKGFEEANVPDPLILRAFLDGDLEELPDTPNYHDRFQSLDDYFQMVEDARAKLQEGGYV